MAQNPYLKLMIDEEIIGETNNFSVYGGILYIPEIKLNGNYTLNYLLEYPPDVSFVDAKGIKYESAENKIVDGVSWLDNSCQHIKIALSLPVVQDNWCAVWIDNTFVGKTQIADINLNDNTVHLQIVCYDKNICIETYNKITSNKHIIKLINEKTIFTINPFSVNIIRIEKDVVINIIGCSISINSESNRKSEFLQVELCDGANKEHIWVKDLVITNKIIIRWMNKLTKFHISPEQEFTATYKNSDGTPAYMYNVKFDNTLQVYMSDQYGVDWINDGIICSYKSKKLHPYKDK